MPIPNDKKHAKQRHMMQAVEHNAAFAKKVGISQATAHEMLHGHAGKTKFHDAVKKHK